MNRIRASLQAALRVAAIAIATVSSRADQAPRAVLPDAVVDLRTTEGVARVKAQWRYSDTRINEIDHRSVGPDLKASGPKNRTFDFMPDARATDFDDSKWEIIPPDSLEKRRGNGRLSLNWYRLTVAIPEKVGGFDTKGSTAVFEIVVDDYAEVSVNGKAPFVLGQNGGAVAAGWNAPNRVVLTSDAKPGDTFAIAVLGINGPLSTHPDTYIWVRSATLDFYARGKLSKAREVKLEVDRKDSALDAILPASAKLEKLADGFAFTEGPVWVPDGEGYLLFSDPNNNVIYRMTPEGDVSVYLTKSGYTGENIGEYRQPGSNGLTLDERGRLTICQHGNRRVVRIEKNGLTTVIADRFEGKRLNSPNDLVYRSDGTLFFTDPPFGLPKFAEDPRRETPHFGVYSVRDGNVQLVSKDFTGPNGLAFSPDEKFLYVGNWDEKMKVVNRYPVKGDGTLGKGELFYDLTSAPGEDAIDGVKVDLQGNVYVSGPGGLWILDVTGKHLATLRGPEHPHNMAWGDTDGRTLYLAAQTGIYRLRLNLPGAGALPKNTAMAKK
ncbi:MAG TPA: SMP-30/gluconolactonase/LRE family protein [Verrucomicrobiae bacterium]|nr:SMP-30/gluconolactonase/LRE family protein [Verrucomicrobiae bacterium]